MPSSSADRTDDAESTDPCCVAGEAGRSEWVTIRVHGEVRDVAFCSHCLCSVLLSGHVKHLGTFCILIKNSICAESDLKRLTMIEMLQI